MFINEKYLELMKVLKIGIYLNDEYYIERYDYNRKKYIFELEPKIPKMLFFDFLNKVAHFLFLKLAILVLPPNITREHAINRYIPFNQKPNLIYYSDFLEDYPRRLGRLE